MNALALCIIFNRKNKSRAKTSGKKNVRFHESIRPVVCRLCGFCLGNCLALPLPVGKFSIIFHNERIIYVLSLTLWKTFAFMNNFSMTLFNITVVEMNTELK